MEPHESAGLRAAGGAPGKNAQVAPGGGRWNPLFPMPVNDLDQLAERLRVSDPSDAHEQREIYERIRNLRAAFDGPLDPESQRCLEAAGMLVAYLARMGSMAGEDVRVIAVRLLKAASEAETA